MYNRSCPQWQTEILVHFRWRRASVDLRPLPIPAQGRGGRPQRAAAWRRSGYARLICVRAQTGELMSIHTPMRFREEKDNV